MIFVISDDRNVSVIFSHATSIRPIDPAAGDELIEMW